LRQENGTLKGRKTGYNLLGTLLVLLVCAGFPWAMMPARPAVQAPAVSEATGDKIIHYIRFKFAVPDTVKLSMGGVQPSPLAPDFNQVMVNVINGNQVGAQLVLVSKDNRYLIVPSGGIIDLQTPNSTSEMEQRIRGVYKQQAPPKLSVGGFKPSPYPDFQEGTLTLGEGASKQDRMLLLTRDGKHLIMSDLFSLAVDPQQQALRGISLRDEPTQGPANAPVTIVEYADLECPTCARMNEFLETQVVPRYGDKVRIVFKEYPLPFHDWSRTAAIACQCAYELNPSTFVPLRTAIFRNQQQINITNVRDTVLNYGEQVGLDRVKLSGCLDAQSSFPRIQRDMAEAKRLDVNQTPTVFINGRMLLGLPSEDAYYQAIDQALRGGN
jgi:protein-disulfide isomerase